MEQKVYLMLVQVMWEVKSQTILKNLKKEIACVWLETLVKHDSNQIKQRRTWKYMSVTDGHKF